jgi:hypothetical protein
VNAKHLKGKSFFLNLEGFKNLPGLEKRFGMIAGLAPKQKNHQ